MGFFAPYYPVFMESLYNEYGKIIQKMYRNCIQPYSVRIRENTVQKNLVFLMPNYNTKPPWIRGFFALYSPVFRQYGWIQFQYIFWIIFPYSLYKDSVNTMNTMQKKPVFTVVLCYDLAVDWADIIKSEKKNIFHLNVF